MASRPALILASSSPYRRELLQRLRVPFAVHAPHIDERPLATETPENLARRLALAKAHAIALQHPAALVIGADQVADLNGSPLGKPGNHESAVAQLRAMSGKSVVFHTAVAVVCHARNYEAQAQVPVVVRVRQIGNTEIERYLRAETPYDCAGSAKVETLGIALLESVGSDDPTALVGLPLIQTCAMMRAAGLDPLGE